MSDNNFQGLNLLYFVKLELFIVEIKIWKQYRLKNIPADYTDFYRLFALLFAKFAQVRLSGLTKLMRRTSASSDQLDDQIFAPLIYT